MSKEGRSGTELNEIEGVLVLYFKDFFAASEIDSERREIQHAFDVLNGERTQEGDGLY